MVALGQKEVPTRLNEGDTYLSYIKTLADKNKSDIFKTSDLNEAAIIMAEIFRHAKSEVKIYDHCLNDDISGKNDYFNEQLYRFLADGKRLKIVLRDNEQPYSRIYFTLSEYARTFTNQIEIKSASDEFNENINRIFKKDVNFIVNDRNAFRVELDLREKASDTVPAICSFNDPKIVQTLNEAFNPKFDTCNDIQLKSFFVHDRVFEFK